MNLRRTLAFIFPPIRQVVETRDRLFEELQLANARINDLEQNIRVNKITNTEVQTRSSNSLQIDELGHSKLLSDLEFIRTELQLKIKENAIVSNDLESLEREFHKLEEATASTRLAKSQNRLFITDYAYFPSPREIEKAAGGIQIEAFFRKNEVRMRDTLKAIAQHVRTLKLIPRIASAPLAPCWENPWFPPFDGAALYGLIAVNKPSYYIEVGSGISTRFARQAITDLGLSTKIISIDPHPHNPVDGLCDKIIVDRAENMSAEFWNSLKANDIVFIDNSHRCFPGSDVTVFFTEVMPALPLGVIYGIHDIFLPFDYPSAWNERFYSEQYLLMTYLLGGFGSDEILLPVYWLTHQPQLHGILDELWNEKILFDGLMTHGGAFWARRGQIAEEIFNP
jgi:hypothetical protein